MNYGEENLNDLYKFANIQKFGPHSAAGKILIFFTDLPVYLSDRHSGGKYQYSIAVSDLCIFISVEKNPQRLDPEFPSLKFQARKARHCLNFLFMSFFPPMACYIRFIETPNPKP